MSIPGFSQDRQFRKQLLNPSDFDFDSQQNLQLDGSRPYTQDEGHYDCTTLSTTNLRVRVGTRPTTSTYSTTAIVSRLRFP